MENLLCQRFNFFLVLFSLFLTAAFSSQSHIGRGAILVAGSILSFMLWLTIYRAHVKFEWIKKHLKSCTGHPVPVQFCLADRPK